MQSYFTVNPAESVSHLLYCITTFGTIKATARYSLRNATKVQGHRALNRFHGNPCCLQGKNIIGGISFALICILFLIVILLPMNSILCKIENANCMKIIKEKPTPGCLMEYFTFVGKRTALFAREYNDTEPSAEL